MKRQFGHHINEDESTLNVRHSKELQNKIKKEGGRWLNCIFHFWALVRDLHVITWNHVPIRWHLTQEPICCAISCCQLQFLQAVHPWHTDPLKDRLPKALSKIQLRHSLKAFEILSSIDCSLLFIFAAYNFFFACYCNFFFIICEFEHFIYRYKKYSN